MERPVEIKDLALERQTMNVTGTDYSELDCSLLDRLRISAKCQCKVVNASRCQAQCGATEGEFIILRGRVVIARSGPLIGL